MNEERESYNTVKDLAIRWNVSSDTIYRMINEGDLSAFKVRGVWRIPTSEITKKEKNLI